jgi:soluble lytic murein transglycosylase-like protein
MVALGVLASAGTAAVWLPAARADIFSWRDKHGVIHFTNVPPRGAARKRVVKTGADEAPSPPEPAGSTSASGGSATARTAAPSPAGPRVPRHQRYDSLITEAARIYALPEALIRAVITVESDFDPNVISPVGAEGLMQLMPGTAQAMRVPDSFHPRGNILGGARYLRLLANRFKGDLVLTLAGYHAGEGAVERYGTIPPYESTRRYVQAVLAHYYRLREAESGGGR